MKGIYKMKKDDYFVIVYKILAYLYVQLKNGEEIDLQMIDPQGYLFRIDKKYYSYIIAHLLQEELIEGPVVVGSWDGVEVVEMRECRITPKGIAYLFENSLVEKAERFLKDVKDITPFI